MWLVRFQGGLGIGGKDPFAPDPSKAHIVNDHTFVQRRETLAWMEMYMGKGFWQDERWLDYVYEEIMQDFTFADEDFQACGVIAEQIARGGENVCDTCSPR